MSNRSNEELLAGGNVSKVYRSGNTVRRELKSNSKRIHSLLKQLEHKGFDYAPKYQGIFEHRGRKKRSMKRGNGALNIAGSRVYLFLYTAMQKCHLCHDESHPMIR
jgi:hypothetical protein